MTVATLSRFQGILVIVTPELVVLGVFVARHFQNDIEQARARVAYGNTIVATHCGPIEYLLSGGNRRPSP